MSRRGFTLVELLTTVAIMGLLGGAAVGGYRQMQRGMEERGAIQNVNAFVRAALQRAQIDRQPTAVYFWNECLRSQTADENEVVVGKAVAVRRYGRITKKVGNNLVDEFGDLDLAYPNDKVTEDDNDAKNASPSGQYSTKRLYQLDAVGKGLKYSDVRDQVASVKMNEFFLTHSPSSGDNDDDAGQMTSYAFVIEKPGTADWKVGSAYGFEFATLELPHGFIFGSSYSRNAENPITEVKTLLFKPTGLSGDSQVDICALRQNGVELRAEKVGTSENPTTRHN